MRDAFGKLFMLMVAVLVFCLAPLVSMTQNHDAVVQEIVYLTTVDFVEDVRKQGKITQDMYTSFIAELDNTDLLYNVQMTHSHDVVSPGFNSEGNVTDIVNSTDIMYTEQILDSLFTEKRDDGTEGVYLMSQGDTFSVVITNREATMNQRLSASLFGTSQDSSAIYAVYGGVIRDEN